MRIGNSIMETMKETKLKLYLYRRHLLLELRVKDHTSWTNKGISVRINLINILRIHFVICIDM
jgi:hypothetical protein